MASPELFKVIVIDESMHRQLAVKNMLPWKELNCDIVAFAQNNKDAYRLYSVLFKNWHYMLLKKLCIWSCSFRIC